MKLLFFGSCTAFLALSVFANGGTFRYGSLSTSTLGTTGAFSAMPTGPGILAINPAGLTALQQNTVDFGIISTYSQAAFLSPYEGNEDSDSKLSFQLDLFLLHAPRFKKWRAGIGIYQPFVNGISWADNWTGRYLIKNYSESAWRIQPAYGRKLNEHFSVGLAISMTWIRMKWEKALAINDDALLKYEGSRLQPSVIGGIYFTKNKLMAGLSYEYNPSFAFSGEKTTISGLPDSYVQEGQVNVKWSMPLILQAGIGMAINDEVTVAVNFCLPMWNGSDETTERIPGILPGGTVTTIDRIQYTGEPALRIGGEYKFDEKIKFRAGAFYGRSMVKDGDINPANPRSDEFRISCGMSYQIKEKIAMEIGIMSDNFRERKESNSRYGFNGSYETKNIQTGIGVRYVF